MKILRFNESLDIDSENIHIVNGTFNECLSAYNKRLYDNSYQHLFIVKKDLTSKFITKEELELLINSEKYNL